MAMSNKVRIACRRCRTKRIKCDGGVPACGNCQKAGEPCIDVDGRNKAVSIPRDFAANASARISWLEDQIRALSPSFNFDDGPRVDFGFLAAAAAAHAHLTPQPAAPLSEPPDPILQPASTSTPEYASSTGKRTFAAVSEVSTQESFPDEARSVALDLGLLTLNSDSRQTHYLGTSSGRLFTSLIGAGSPESTDQSPGQANGGRRTSALPSLSRSGRSGSYAYTKRTKETYRLLYDTLRKSLPPEEDAHILLDIYFRVIHIDHPFLHPGSLLDAVEALYQCAAADAATAEIGYNGWAETIWPFSYNGDFDVSKDGSHCTPISVFTATFHVFMVFTLAATVRTRQRVYDFAPQQFYRVAMSVGPHCFSSTSIPSLQATLLLAVHSLLGPAELNIWTLIYVAMAHCVDLGLHRATSGDAGLFGASVLTSKMVFFTVYHLDRSIATIQGRPLGIRDETFDLQVPALEDVQADVASIWGKAFAPEMALAGGLAFAIHRFKLDPIISEIKLVFYHLPSQVTGYALPSDPRSSQAAIQMKLDEWRSGLSAIAAAIHVESEEEPSEHRNYELKLTSQYYAAKILLHQPSQAIPQPSESSLLICYQCAVSRLKTYNELYNADGYFQSWRSVQGVFSSGATMIYSLWTSSLVRRTIPAMDAMKDLRTCTNLLSAGGELWPSVKKGKESLGRAMDALLRILDVSRHQTQRQDDISADDGRPKRRFRPTEPTQAEFTPPQATAVDLECTHLQGTDKRGTSAEFYQGPTNYSTADWTLLDNDMFLTSHQHFSEIFPDINRDTQDDTVPAFIAEFLGGDTAWKPF